MNQNRADNTESQDIQQSVPSILSKRKLLPGDKVLWTIVVMLFAISLVAVYTASSKRGFAYGTIDSELKKHFITLCGSAVVLFICYILGAKLLRKCALFAFSSSWLATLLPYFVSSAKNDAHRWLDLGFVEFQPSELLKIGTVMLLAAQLSAIHHRIGSVRLLPTTFDVRKWKTPKELNIIKNDIIPIVLPIALSCVVILPAHSSSAIHIFFVSIVLLFIAGIRFKEIMKLTAVALVCGLLVLFVAGRWGVFIQRSTARLNMSKMIEASLPPLVTNLDELTEEQRTKFEEKIVATRVKTISGRDDLKDPYFSRLAIQNGGVFGVGAGRSMMRAKLTNPDCDYLFAIVVEEFGLLLSFMIALIYLWLFFRSLRIFEKCEWLFGGLLAVGLAFLITSQGFLHISVTLGILPETGQNLPFITHGRSSMVAAAIAIGLILSISRQVEQGTLLPPSQRGGNKHI